jgi:PAS domain-containing protein
MTEINLNARRNNVVTFLTRSVLVLMLWVCLVMSGLFFFITEENNKSMVAEQRVDLMLEQLNELQLEALELFIYSTNIIPHDPASVEELSNKEQVLQARVAAELEEMIRIYREIDNFPVIELDLERLLEVQDVEQKMLIIERFQESLILARSVLHEFKLLKKQEYLISFQLFQNLVIGFALVTLLGLLFTYALMRKRLSVGLESVLNLVKKFHHKQYSYSPDWHHNDEFRDIFFHLQQLKESNLVNAHVIERDKSLLEHYFQNIQEPCLALNSDRRYVFCNQLFELIWSEYQVEIESSLCDLDEPSLELVDIKIAETKNNDNLPSLFRFNGLAYTFNEEEIFEEGRLIGYLLTFTPVSDELEYEAVTKLVSLMSNDVWNAPVRVMREESKVAALAVQLEKIRLSVTSLINLFDGMTVAEEKQKVTSLKEVGELVIMLSESLTDANDKLTKQEVTFIEDESESEFESQDELDFEPLKGAVLELRQKVENSIFFASQLGKKNTDSLQGLESNLLLGYENLNQSLTIVHKGVEASVNALQDSSDCMSEVKVAVLNAIVNKDESDIELDALQSIAVDLSHDIDTVSQMLQDSLAQEKESLAILESDIESCQERSVKAKNAIQEFSLNNQEDELTSHSENMMKDVFSLDDVLERLIEKSKP